MTNGQGLLQQVTLPTRITESTETLIDHVYTRNSNLITTDVIITDISDHYATLTKYIGKKRRNALQK